MNKTCKKILFGSVFLLCQIPLLQAQDHTGHHHDNPCRTENIALFQSYTRNTAFEDNFKGKFPVSFAEFKLVNQIYYAALETRTADSLCKNPQFAIEKFVFDFIEIYKNDLEFSFDPNENYTLKPGKYARVTNDPAIVNKAVGQPCQNADFELNTYAGWETYCGKTNGTAYTVVNQTAYTPGIGASCLGGSWGDQHVIFNGGSDPIVPSIPMVNPNGGIASVRIGDGTAIQAYGSVLKQTFLVDANSSVFSYSYAAVLEDPNHQASNQPFFKVKLTDQAGNEINCGNYQSYAGDNQPGWIDMGAYWYRNWTTSFVNLNAYIGQNITIEFSVGDCSQTGHYGYAYVEAACSPVSLQSSGPGICTGQALTISAPATAANYFWNTGESTQSIQVNAPGYYEVNLTPLNGGACGLTLGITVPALPTPTADFTLQSAPCSSTVAFNNTSTVSGSGTISAMQWNFGDGIQSPYGLGNISGTFNTTGTYNNPTHIYPINGTYNVNLTVVSTEGCTSSVNKPILISAPPVVNAGADFNVCENDSISLLASGANSYVWSNGANNGQPFLSPAGTYTWIVTGTATNGCTDTDSIQVNVLPAPIVIAPADTAICSGDSLSLTATGNALGFNWTGGISNSIPFLPGSTTLYHVSYTAANGCSASDSTLVSLLAPPNVNAGTDIVSCENNPISLQANGANNYLWSPNAQNGVPFTLPVGTYTYVVTGTNAAGCSDSDSLQIQIIANPVVQAGPDTAICSGENITLQANGNAPSYTWNNGVIDNTPFNPSATQTYIVTYTSPQGCSASDSIVVVVNPNPIVNAGNDTTLCQNQALTLSGNGANQYSWNNGIQNGIPFYQNTGSVTYTLVGTDANGCSGTDMVTVTVEASPIVNAGADTAFCIGNSYTFNGTSNTAPLNWIGAYQNGNNIVPQSTQSFIAWAESANGCRTYDTVWVDIYPLPNVDAGEDQHLCRPEWVNLFGNGAVHYSWSNGIQNGIAFEQNANEMTYILLGTDANGCSNTDTVSVYMYDGPNADFSVNPQSGNAPLPVTISDNSSGNNLSYYWDFGNGSNSFDNNPTFQEEYLNPGTYSIVLMVDDGLCKDSATKFVEVLNFVKPEYNIPNVFTPNQSGPNETFHLSLKNVKEVRVFIYNRWGQLVNKLTDVQAEWDGTNLFKEEAVEGVYYFVYEITGFDDELIKGEGFVHLFR